MFKADLEQQQVPLSEREQLLAELDVQLDAEAEPELQEALASLASWNTGSCLLGFAAAVWLPLYDVFLLRQFFTALDYFQHFVCFFFVWIMVFLVCRVLRHPYLAYQESYYLQLALLHTKLNLADESGVPLRVWKQIRSYLVMHRGPQLNGLAQWSLLAALLTSFLEIFIVVLNVVLHGFGILTQFYMQIQLAVAIGFIVYSFAMVRLAVSVWVLQQQHMRMLQEVLIAINNGHVHDELEIINTEVATASFADALKNNAQLKESVSAISVKVGEAVQPLLKRGQEQIASRLDERNPAMAEAMRSTSLHAEPVLSALESSLFSSSSPSTESSSMNRDREFAASSVGSALSPAAMALSQSISELIRYIQAHDVAPEAFGISMKPTLLQVLYGYVASAIAALVARYATTYF